MTMKGVNLDTYNLSLLTAKEDILNPRASTNWALFTYEGITNNLKLADSGAGGVVELAGKFHAGRPMYGLCRLGCTETGVPRVIMICWVGPNVDEYRRTECASHIPAIKNFFKEAHTFVTASNAEDVTEEKLSTAMAKVRPPMQAQRRSSVPVDKEETVGTNYRKTNAAMEMRRINRDSFWAHAEREEEERKEEDRRRAAEERRRRERERIMQERKEAEERDRKMNEKLQMIEEQRRQQALMEEEMRRKEKTRWELQQREHEEELRERFKRSESIEKAAEAAALVSQRSTNPREFFRQLSSSSSQPPTSPLSPHTGKPPFRRYRRSLTDTAFIFQKSDGGPSSPLSPRGTSPSPSPSPFAQSPRRTPTSPPPYSSGFSQPSRSPLRSPPASPQRSTPPMAPLPSMPPSRPLPPPALSPVPAQSQPEPSTLASPGLQASLVEDSSFAPACPPGSAIVEPLPESPEHPEDLCLATHSLGSLELEAGLSVRAVLVEEEEEDEEEKEEEVQRQHVEAQMANPTVVCEEEEKEEEEEEEVMSAPVPEASMGCTELEAQPEAQLEAGAAEVDVQESMTEETQPQGESEAQPEEEEEEEEEQGEEEEMEEGVKGEVVVQEVYVEAGQEEEDSKGPVDTGEEALEQCDDMLVMEQSRTLQNGTEKEYMHMTGMDPNTTCTLVYDDIMEEQGKEISENGDEGSPERQLCVRALYDYEAEDESELSFAPGDIISDVETVDKGWWRGFSKDGRQGLFPANYVETI